MNSFQRKLTYSSLALLGGAAAASAAPQTVINPKAKRGIASVWPAGLSETTRQVGPSGVEDPVLMKLPGDQGNPPTEWARIVPGSPDYSRDAMFPTSRYKDADENPVEVYKKFADDAFSAGCDLWGHVDDNGVMDITSSQGRWLVCAATIEADAPVNLESYLASVSDPGSEVISYCFAESKNIHQSIPGQTLVEQRSGDLGYSSGGARDVNSLDYAIGSFTVDPGSQRARVLFPNPGQYYFSVTPTFATWFNSTVSPAHFARENGSPVPADPASIYVIGWNSTSGTWTEPTVYVSASDLAFGGTSIADVDAVGVNAGNGVVVFSSALDSTTPVVPQLLVYDPMLATASKVRILKDKVGTNVVRVTDKLSIPRESDIDGVCGYDPEGVVADPFHGIPVTAASEYPPLGYLTQPMGISLSRGVPGLNQQDGLYLHVTGWGDAPEDLYWIDVWVRQSSAPLKPNENPVGPTVSGWTTARQPIPRLPGQDVLDFSVPGFVHDPQNPVIEVFVVLWPLSPPPDADALLPAAASWVTQVHY